MRKVLKKEKRRRHRGSALLWGRGGLWHKAHTRSGNLKGKKGILLLAARRGKINHVSPMAES